MGKRSSRRDRENQVNRTALRARVSVLEPIRESPYGPAAFVKPHQEAEHTSVPDHMLPGVQISLASTGASTHVRPSRPWLLPGHEKLLAAAEKATVRASRRKRTRPAEPAAIERDRLDGRCPPWPDSLFNCAVGWLPVASVGCR